MLIIGSASDVVKSRMNGVNAALWRAFPDCRNPMSPNGDDTNPRRGAFLTLQMHDELVYEVSRDDVSTVASLVKAEMERTSLRVQTPVRIKVGSTWGSLQEIQL